jgi:hypothetical protein
MAHSPPLKDRHRKWGGKYNYFKFYDREGVHFIFSGLSYPPAKRGEWPVWMTYKLFFYTTMDGRWVEEMEPLTAVFDLVGDGIYAPRKTGGTP